MEAQYRAAAEASDSWRRRAEWALRKDDEDLAREALKRRKTYEVCSSPLAGWAWPACDACWIARTCREPPTKQHYLRGWQERSSLYAVELYCMCRIVLQSCDVVTPEVL